MQSTLADKQITSFRKQGDFSCLVCCYDWVSKQNGNVWHDSKHHLTSAEIKFIHSALHPWIDTSQIWERGGLECHLQEVILCNSACKKWADVLLAAEFAQLHTQHNPCDGPSDRSHQEHTSGTWNTLLLLHCFKTQVSSQTETPAPNTQHLKPELKIPIYVISYHVLRWTKPCTCQLAVPLAGGTWKGHLCCAAPRANLFAQVKAATLLNCAKIKG